MKPTFSLAACASASAGAPSAPSAPAAPSALTSRRRCHWCSVLAMPFSSIRATFNRVILHEGTHTGSGRPAGLPRCAQLVALDLARRGLGQLGDELDPARVFVMREM